MIRKFGIQKKDNRIVLFNLAGIEGLKVGDIFFKRYEDGSTAILQDFKYLGEEYLNSIVDKLEGEEFNFGLLETKSI